MIRTAHGSLLLLLLTTSTMPAHVGTPARPQQDPRPLTPNDAVLLAAADLAGIPDQEARHHTRYLSLHFLAADARPDFTQSLDFALNSLSRRKGITYCAPVAGSNGAVVRLYLISYGLTPGGWETLATRGSGPVRIAKKADQPEEYFSYVSKGKKVTRQRQRKDAQGRLLFFDIGTPTERPAMEDYEAVITPSAWLDPVAIEALQDGTGSTAPILRADWFLANALIAPAYQELFGFKKLRDFQELVHYRSEDFSLATKGIVTNSQEVAHNSRALLFTPTVTGQYMESFDFFSSRGLDNLLKDPLRRTRDAGEIIANLPNGLQAYLLVNGKDEVIDFADPQIAAYRHGPWRNPLVWTGISCMACHDEGVKNITEEVRRLAQPPIGLSIPLSESRKAEEVKDLFFSGGVDELVANGKATYRTRVMLASRGLTPQVNAGRLNKIFVGYWQDTMTLDDAARDVGSTAAELRPLIVALEAPAPDVTLAQLSQGLPVRRDQFLDGGYQQLATIVYQLRRGKP